MILSAGEGKSAKIVLASLRAATAWMTRSVDAGKSVKTARV